MKAFLLARPQFAAWDSGVGPALALVTSPWSEKAGAELLLGALLWQGGWTR